jgi:hypothetical protein
MLLSREASNSMLERFGVYAKEACDRCGQILGPVRFTRAGESGAWCSRQCRDGADVVAPGTCRNCGGSLSGFRRGTTHCSATCRKRDARESQTASKSRDRARITKDLETRFKPSAITTPSAPQIGSNA